jgi:hypothetical protein
MSLRRCLLATAFAAALAATTLKDCAPGTSVFHFDAAHLEPADPQPGDVVDLHLSYTVPAGIVIRGGVTEYDVTVNYIPIQPYTEPLCQDVLCPLEKGHYTNVTQTTWPTGVHGLVVNKMRWKGEDEEVLLCLQITTKFAAGGAGAA